MRAYCVERESAEHGMDSKDEMRYLRGMGDMERVTATGMGRCGYETMGLVAMG